MKLYELPIEWREIEEAIDQADGELSPELLERLDDFEDSLAVKVESVCKVALNHAAEAAALETEARRFADRARAAKAKSDRLKSYLKETLEAVGQTKLDAGFFKVAVQRNSQPSVEVLVPLERLPEQYKRLTIEADRKALLDAHKAGQDLPEGVSITTGTHLRIR